ncbi:MAG: TolC family protein [Magnetococcales bacterium]|nr:TolC family protein [Magnetococcales bacterium]
MTQSRHPTLRTATQWSLLLFSSWLLTGCAVTPDVITSTEMNQQRQTDLTRMFQNIDPISHPLTLSEVMARALRFNLDHRVKVMEEALAMDLSGLDRFELLPTLAANAAFSSRSNHSASSSRSMLTGNQSLEVSTSQDRDRATADLGLTWNILDFGVSYFNARQNADRLLIAKERERKVIQNLMQETRSAFWRAAAAQQLEPRVHATIKLAETALKDARKAEESQLRSPVESLRYRKGVLENLRQLEAILQELATAQVELAAMMTLPPGTRFQLAIPEGALRVPVWNLPVEKMEELALLSQPDMREMAYQVRIVADESRKSLLRLLPGISLNASRQWDRNSYALNKSWNEAGMRVTWNLLGLLSAPAQMEYNQTSEEVIATKQLALRMALLSQVHIAQRQFDQSVVQLKRADELMQVEKQLATHTENRAAQEAQAAIDRIASDTSAILAELRRFQALAAAHNALGKMMATTGQDPEVFPIQQGSLADLTARVDRWLATQIQEPPAPVAATRVKPQAQPQVQTQPAPAANTATPLTVGQTGKITNKTQVHSGKGKHYRKIRLLQPGDAFTVLEVSNDGQWWRIGKREWIPNNSAKP